eukprot:GILJ01000935.1.p1 GENE.GILJ01000935.1~~GILJ01000935.1.p1  ORF type:complete len:483 (-),score=72.03 GILJ01000935.1:146-1594(-)
MQFTPQQLQGAGRFNPKCRIGNWSEDIELEEARLKDYLRRKQRGELLINKTQRKLAKSLAPVELSVSPDGFLRFGDNIMFLNAKTKAFLAVDIWEKLKKVEDSYAVTCTNIQTPVARNVLSVASAEDQPNGEIVRYGQKIRLLTHASLTDNRNSLFLHTESVSPLSFAKYSRHQEVSMFTRPVWDTVWQIEHANPAIRFEYEGQPVEVNAPIVIRHVHTANFLASDNIVYRNDYGDEFEVACHTYLTTNKTHNLVAERAGRLTVDVPSRGQQDQNIWIAISSQAYGGGMESPKAAQVDDVLSSLRAALQARGLYGIRRISRIFRKIAGTRGVSVDKEDVRYGLQDVGVPLSEGEISSLIRRFDTSADGKLNVVEFLAALKGSLPERRANLVHQAYHQLADQTGGRVTLGDIAYNFDPTYQAELDQKNPEVIYNEFMSEWDTQEVEAEVHLDEFLQYYTDLSASISSEEYFEALLRNTWHLQG